ncbi:MAG: LUD domain-containing protein [Bacteroidia bacterium]|nr:LUD domain-containing protein [Bacteroidia bacterium]
MDESTNKEKVLKKIRASLLSKTNNPYPKLSFDSPVFRQTDEDPVVVFAERAEAAGVRFFLVESELEFMESLVSMGMQHRWKNILCVEEGLSNLLTECELPHEVLLENMHTMDVAVSSCECLIARTGSIVLSSKEHSRSIPSYTPVHVVLGRASQVALDIKDAFSWLKHKYPKMPSSVSIITGPSRTADIDGELVIGAHGPKQLYVFVIDDRKEP